MWIQQSILFESALKFFANAMLKSIYFDVS